MNISSQLLEDFDEFQARFRREKISIKDGVNITREFTNAFYKCDEKLKLSSVQRRREFKKEKNHHVSRNDEEHIGKRQRSE